jgi:6-phosphogluconolactonase/glucosamine-6-phosphate isomerase/deaminase
MTDITSTTTLEQVMLAGKFLSYVRGAEKAAAIKKSKRL